MRKRKTSSQAAGDAAAKFNVSKENLSPSACKQMTVLGIFVPDHLSDMASN